MKLSNIMEMRRGHVYVPVSTIDRSTPHYKRQRARIKKIQTEIMDAPTPAAGLQAALKWRDASSVVRVRVQHANHQQPLKILDLNVDRNTITVGTSLQINWSMKTIPTQVYDLNALTFKGRERVDTENTATYQYTYIFELSGDPIKSERIPNPSYDQTKVDASTQKRRDTLDSRRPKEPEPQPKSKLEQKYGKLRQPGWDWDDD